MRINSIKSKKIGPILEFNITELGDIVIIAGANGSGKTQLKNAITQTIQNGSSTNLEIGVQSTRKDEKIQFGNKNLTLNQTANGVFQAYSGTRTRGGTFTGFVINIDSNRTISNVKFSTFGYYISDPDDEETPSNYYFSSFLDRWSNVVNKIYQMAASRDRKISKLVVDGNHSELSQEEILKRFPDRFIEFQKVFSKLLPNKNLQKIDPSAPKEFHYKLNGEEPSLPFGTLSSGEQEVVKICFDFLLKKISHCVVMIDEPELHLHPSLTFKLIETLKSLGANNQFVFFTHSADLITTYYNSGNVYFIDNQKSDGNQACKLRDIHDNHSSIAQFISRDLGVFAVSKNIIFVEGKEGSIDKLTYHKIAETIFPSFIVAPIGSVSSLKILNQLCFELNESIFGINFFMIRDRDGLSNEQVNNLTELSSGRFVSLNKRHLENYFLDPEILATIAKNFYLNSKWHNPENVKDKLREIAKKFMNLAIMNEIKNDIQLKGTIGLKNPDNLERKSVDRLITDFNEICNQEKLRVDSVLNPILIESNIRALVTKYEKEFTQKKDAVWSTTFPGKDIFNRFCSEVMKTDDIQIRQAYVDEIIKRREASNKTPMDSIFKSFESFYNISEMKKKE